MSAALQSIRTTTTEANYTETEKTRYIIKDEDDVVRGRHFNKKRMSLYFTLFD